MNAVITVCRYASVALAMSFVRRGFDSGKFDQCDTFSAEDL